MLFRSIRQADSTEADEYLGTKAEATQRWFPLEDIHAAVRQVRAVSDAKVVLGGFTFTANPVSAAEYLQPDFGVIGEPDDFIAQFERVMAGIRRMSPTSFTGGMARGSKTSAFRSVRSMTSNTRRKSWTRLSSSTASARFARRSLRRCRA